MTDIAFPDGLASDIGLAFSPNIEKGLAGVMAFTSPDPVLGLNFLVVATERLSCLSDGDGPVVDKIDFPFGVIRFAVLGKADIRFGSETASGKAVGVGRSKPVPSVFSPARIG